MAGPSFRSMHSCTVGRLSSSSAWPSISWRRKPAITPMTRRVLSLQGSVSSQATLRVNLYTGSYCKKEEEEDILEVSMQRAGGGGGPRLQHQAVQRHAATMLELGSSLLSRSAQHTHKLGLVEAKVTPSPQLLVLNQTSRMELRLLENSLSTNRLEKEILLQTNQIDRLHQHNSHLEQKVQMLESQQRGELEVLRADKNKLQLMESIHTLLHMVAGTTGFAVPWWRDCADIYKAGHLTSGLYDIYISNTSHPVQVYCDMETSGGGWLVFQKRFNGSVDFQRTWREYKMGFGDPLGEQWLGTEALHRLSLLGQYSLRVELQDWEGNHVYAQYDRFSLASETHGYRIPRSGTQPRVSTRLRSYKQD
ncbi:hypothetical protein CRUP_013965 [Coryphaenoides rupestris]|nr:hypothetical protein CRUP_013965 [Coryphaenoides rupestris]